MAINLDPSLRKWLSVGSGIGIEIGLRDLRVTLVRVRPSGVRLLAQTTIENYRQRPAAEWGAGYNAFLRKHGVAHLAATVLLPRNEVIIRLAPFPGVSDKDLPAALRYQADSFHPFPEDEAVYDWSRLGRTAMVLIGIARREIVERHAGLFNEAGVRVAQITVSAAALYAGVRLLRTPPDAGLLTAMPLETGEVEVYGESNERTLFSATFDLPPERAAALSAAELRIHSEAAQDPLALLPAAQGETVQSPLSYAAALVSACPRLALGVNLLPPERRVANSRLMLVPTAALACLLLLMVAALGIQGAWEDRRYLQAIGTEIAQLEPRVRQAASLDQSVERTRNRTRQLDQFRRRSSEDMEVLKEATKLLPPPAWLSSLEVTRTGVLFAGEAEQAAGLLKTFDESPLFTNSDFALGIVRVGAMEAFRIRSQREAPKP
ncbi:MAG TPA: hypothetical protein DEH78_01350 [Solibacterales bacterium]|nr:hypothetical protein [Bryobacterales bacterium]